MSLLEDLNINSDQLKRFIYSEKMNENVANLIDESNKKFKESNSLSNTLQNLKQQYFILENQLNDRLSMENIEALEEQLLIIKRENDSLTKSIVNLKKTTKENDKEIEIYENGKEYPNQISNMTIELKKLINKKHELFTKDKSVVKSLNGLKFFIDSVAQVLEYTSEVNKKQNSESEARLKSKIITILGGNLLFLQDLVNLDEFELEQKMISEEFYLYVDCKVMEIDHVGKFMRSIVLRGKETTINLVGDTNCNSMKIEDDSEPIEMNLENPQEQESKKVLLPPINKKNMINILENNKFNEMNLIKVSGIKKSPKFNTNFGKHNSLKPIQSQIISSYKKTSLLGSSINIPKNVFSKYEYLSNVDKLSKHSIQDMKVIDSKIVLSKRYKFKQSVNSHPQFTNNSGEDINSILETNLNYDFNKTSDEDYNNLKYKEYLLSQVLTKSLSNIEDLEKTNNKQIEKVNNCLEIGKKKIELIHRENELYEDEIQDLYSLLNLVYEEAVYKEQRNNMSNISQTDQILLQNMNYIEEKKQAFLTDIKANQPFENNTENVKFLFRLIMMKKYIIMMLITIIYKSKI